MVQRRLFLHLCTAVYGLALAAALLPRLIGPAPAGQLPGAATSAGVDARASFLFVAALTLLPILSVFLLRRPAMRLADARTWAFVTGSSALLTSLWIALLEQNLLWTAVPPVVVFIAATSARHHAAAFSRRDAILVPTTLSVFLALFDLLPRMSFYQHLILSVLLVLALRLVLTMWPRSGGLPAPLCFAAAPLALALQSHFNGYHQRHDGWPVLLVALVTPLAIRFLVRDTPSLAPSWAPPAGRFGFCRRCSRWLCSSRECGGGTRD